MAKMDNIWGAIEKLSLKDKIVLLLGVVIAGAAFFGGMFYLFTRNSFLTFKFPDSTLQDTNVAQTYLQASYENFPILVRFPETDYGIHVGGEELNINEYATSFKYNDFIIALSVKEGAYSDKEYFAYAVAPVFDGLDATNDNSYKSSISDDGYLNTLYLYYEAGTLHTQGGNYYLVSYEYPVDGKTLIFMVATQKKSARQLLWARDLLDRMLYTLTKIETSSAESVETPEEGRAAESQVEKEQSEPDKSVKYEDSHIRGIVGDETLSKQDKLDILNAEDEELDYSMAYPNATDLEKQVGVTDELSDKDVVFFIFYTISESVPEEAYLIGPDGNTYAPDYLNDNHDGYVYWKMSKPQIGIYTMHLSANLRYGTFKGDVLEESVFKMLFGEVDEPVQHPTD